MDERIPDRTIIIKCASQAQKNSRILHLFHADQWRHSWRPGTRAMYPRPPIRDRGWWSDHFRLRIDGRWHGESSEQYRFYFYTLPEVMEIVSGLMGISTMGDSD